MGLKKFVSKFIKSTDTAAKSEDYSKLFTDLFGDTAFSQYVIDEIVYMLCTNNFKLNPTTLIEFFKSEGLTIDEYFIVMFKVGGLVQLFIDYPGVFLNHAIHKMPKDFTVEEMEVIKEALNGYNVAYADHINLEQEQLKFSTNEITLSSSDEANRLIDKWLKNKKNGDIRNKQSESEE